MQIGVPGLNRQSARRLCERLATSPGVCLKICLVSHGGRDGTDSGSLLASTIADIGEVVQFDASADAGALDDDDLIRTLATTRFDRYVFWRTEHLLVRILPLDLGPTFVAPTPTANVGESAQFWRQFVKCHFISFSRAHHEFLQDLDARTSYFQYFPEIADKPAPVVVSDRLGGFFSERRSCGGSDLAVVLRQCRLLNIGELHVHTSVEAGAGAPVNRVRDRVIDGIQVHHSGWIADPAEFDRIQGAPLFHFTAPTPDGTEYPMLSAMARGQIVVAPDLPIFNEYISHRHSGLLYDLGADKRESLAGIGVIELARISENARAKMARGRRAWVDDQERLRSIISCDGRRWPTRDCSAHFADRIRTSAHERIRDGR